MEFLFLPFALTVEFPWLPFAIGGVFAFAGWRRRSIWVWLAAVLWPLYGLWELSVQTRMPLADIRIDLMLIAPVLLVTSLLAIVFALRRKKNA